MRTPVKTETGLVLSSTAFSQNGNIPRKYSCEGAGINPPLEITGFPEETKALALIVEDPDTGHGVFDHWLVWDIPPNEPIAEGYVPGTGGRNSSGKTGYTPPCPPSGSHRYFFRVYALDCFLRLAEGSDKKSLQDAMSGHVLASAELMAHYKKNESSGL